MGFELQIFNDGQLETDYIEWLVDEKSVDIQVHFTRLCEYYSNRIVNVNGTGAFKRKINESGCCYLQAQEYGLPSRITGLVHSTDAGVFGSQAVKDVQRKEVVIENDIAWRINAAVDFLFGKPISFVSRASESRKRAEIESILKALFSANGAIVPRQHACGLLTRPQVSARELPLSLQHYSNDIRWWANPARVNCFNLVFQLNTSRLVC